MEMNYAIQVLENEIHQLSKIMNEWPVGEYQEAFNDRKRKLKQLKEAVKWIKENEV